MTSGARSRRAAAARSCAASRGAAGGTTRDARRPRRAPPDRRQAIRERDACDRPRAPAAGRARAPTRRASRRGSGAAEVAGQLVGERVVRVIDDRHAGEPAHQVRDQRRFDVVRVDDVDALAAHDLPAAARRAAGRARPSASRTDAPSTGPAACGTRWIAMRSHRRQVLRGRIGDDVHGVPGVREALGELAHQHLRAAQARERARGDDRDAIATRRRLMRDTPAARAAAAGRPPRRRRMRPPPAAAVRRRHRRHARRRRRHGERRGRPSRPAAATPQSARIDGAMSAICAPSTRPGCDRRRRRARTGRRRDDCRSCPRSLPPPSAARVERLDRRPVARRSSAGRRRSIRPASRDRGPDRAPSRRRAR